MSIDFDKLKNIKLLPDPKSRDMSLYKLIQKYSIRLHRLIKQLEIIPIETSESLVTENLEILAHYCSLLPAKIYRALHSQAGEKDSKTSAFICFNGLAATSQALLALSREKSFPPVQRKTYLKLAKTSLKLAEVVAMELEFAPSGPEE